MRYILFLLLISCAPTGRNYVKEDNDIFSPKNTDHDYTQGIQFGSEIPDGSGSHEYYARQLIYTPVHKHLSNPDSKERPYAGYLGGGYKANYVQSPNIQDTAGIEFGIVGPHSYAEQTQSEFHRLIGDNVPQGWDYQLKDEPTVLLTLERKYLYDTGFGFEILPLAGANTGNLFTQAYLGGTIRTGYNVPNDFYSGDPIFPRISRNDLSVWGFAGIFERAVAYNLLLDGNTYQDSRSVDSNAFVTEGRIGLAVQWKGYRVVYTFIKQTKEYSTEERGMQFGEITIGWGFG